MADDSISLWLSHLKAGDEDAAQKIWDRYCQQLLAIARRRLGEQARRVADEEDVIQDVFVSLCRGAERGRFPRLNDRTDLWQVLLLLTRQKVIGQVRHNLRQKRGNGEVQGESAIGLPGEVFVGIDQVQNNEPGPELLATIDEQFQKLLKMLTDEQRTVARMRLEGFSNDEIADKFDLSSRSVERKLSRIREKWGTALGLTK